MLFWIVINKIRYERHKFNKNNRWRSESARKNSTFLSLETKGLFLSQKPSGYSHERIIILIYLSIITLNWILLLIITYHRYIQPLLQSCVTESSITPAHLSFTEHQHWMVACLEMNHSSLPSFPSISCCLSPKNGKGGSSLGFLKKS